MWMNFHLLNMKVFSYDFTNDTYYTTYYDSYCITKFRLLFSLYYKHNLGALNVHNNRT